jgi:hypothetical protein
MSIGNDNFQCVGCEKWFPLEEAYFSSSDSDEAYCSKCFGHEDEYQEARVEDENVDYELDRLAEEK